MNVLVIISIVFAWVFLGWMANGITSEHGFFPKYKRMSHLQKVDMWFFILFSPLAVTCLLIYLVIGKIVRE